VAERSGANSAAALPVELFACSGAFDRVADAATGYRELAIRRRASP